MDFQLVIAGHLVVLATLSRANAANIVDLLGPSASEEMEISKANPKVGNIRNNGPEMMRAAAEAAEEGELPL